MNVKKHGVEEKAVRMSRIWIRKRDGKQRDKGVGGRKWARKQVIEIKKDQESEERN